MNPTVFSTFFTEIQKGKKVSHSAHKDVELGVLPWGRPAQLSPGSVRGVALPNLLHVDSCPVLSPAGVEGHLSARGGHTYFSKGD